MAERPGFFQSLMGYDPSLPQTPREFFAHLPMLETSRLILRCMTMRDAADIFAYSRDPEVARYVLWDAHRSLAETRAYLRFILRQYRDGMPSSWCIVHKASGRVIGTIGYMAYSQDHETVEVGYSLSRAFWNHGLMTEALQAVLNVTFERLNFHRIEAQHDARNPASGHVMIKCGMRYEGRLRGRIFNKGQFIDVDMYALLRDDWLQQHTT